MSTSPPPEAVDAAFVCDSDDLACSACEGLPFFKEHEGKRYCVLHYPGKDKSAAFNEALKRKLDAEDFNFCGVWFPDNVDFGRYTFSKSVTFIKATFGAEAYFNSATFDAEANFCHATFAAGVLFDRATFNSNVYFMFAKFGENGHFYSTRFDSDADFFNAIFSGFALFGTATFNGRTTFNAVMFGKEAHFHDATFGAAASFNFARFDARAVFHDATFGGVISFHSATFSEEVSFLAATFKDFVRFAGDGKSQVFGDASSLNLQFARIEKPDRFSFNTLTLRPQWFVNVDARRFEFINANWSWLSIGLRINTRKEVKSLENRILSAHRLLSIAYRNLAVNAEENHRYEEASRFRYMAMDARRLERWRGFAIWTLGWWYWLASGYGERVWRAFVVLMGVWLLAAALYTQVGFVRWEPRVSSEQEAWGARRDEVGQPLRWQRALTYSLGVMTLQKPEPRPATDAAQAVVMLEMILGPVQAALLALAIRRKFMR